MPTTETDTFTPTFQAWRHGGWYVTNISYPNGAVGCVSRNYTDRKWRIVCRNTGPGEPGDVTYPSRDAAARAERDLTLALHAVKDAGALAYRAGAPVLSCPYRSDRERAEAWMFGWLETWVKPGRRFVHARHRTPVDGTPVAEWPYELCEVTAVRRGHAYYRPAGATGRADSFCHVSSLPTTIGSIPEEG